MRVSIKKELLTFVLGASAILAIGAGISKISLMINESTGECSQSVNFTGTTTLNSAAIATQAYSNDVVTTHNADGAAHSGLFANKAASGANSDITSISGLTTALSIAQGGTGATTANDAKSNIGLSNVANILNKLDATAAPTAGDDSADGYSVGSRWLDVTNSKEYVCKDATEAAAVWIDVTAGGTGGYDGDITTLDIDGGTDIGADVTDSDLIIVDDGAGGTNRKSEISRLWTYIASKITGTGVSTALIDTVTEKTSDNGVSIEGMKLKDSYIELSEISAPVNPDSDKIKVYAKDNGSGTTKVYLKDSAGTETELGSGTDSNAIHKTTAAEINALTEKTTPANDDEIVIEDSADSYAKKKVKISNLPSGSGSTSDTSWTGANWTSTTSSPSQRAVQELAANVGVDTLAANLETSDHQKIVTSYVSGGFADSSIEAHSPFLKAYWGLASTADSVGTHTLTNNGTVSFANDGKNGKDATFSGSNYLSAAHSSDFVFGSNNFTLVFWVKPTAVGQSNNSEVLAKTASSSAVCGWAIYQEAGSYDLWFRASSNGSSFDIAHDVDIGTMTVDTWHMVSVVRSGSSIKLSLDNTLNNTVTTSATLYDSGTSPILFGGGNYSSTYFTGQMDEVLVWPGAALDSTVLTDLYNSGTGKFYGTAKKYTNSSTKISDINFGVCQGRLTLESGVPISTTDQTAKTTLYFTPNVTGQNPGNKIAIYDGTKWVLYSFSELSLSISSLTASTNYDIFIYDNSGTLTLSATAWTDATTRATALYNQDGIYVKTGATNYRYLGTIRTTATTGQCEDSAQNRFVWNLYNQKRRIMNVFPGYNNNGTYTAVSVTNTTWAEFTGGGSSGAGTISFVVGISGEVLSADTYAVMITASGYQSYIGIGYDSTSTAQAMTFANNNYSIGAFISHIVMPAAGKHSLSMLCATAGGTATWYCDLNKGGTIDSRATGIKSIILN